MNCATILPAETDGSTAKLRVFILATELAFAGYPTIGSALELAWQNDVPLNGHGEAEGEQVSVLFEEGDRAA